MRTVKYNGRNMKVPGEFVIFSFFSFSLAGAFTLLMASSEDVLAQLASVQAEQVSILC